MPIIKGPEFLDYDVFEGEKIVGDKPWVETPVSEGFSSGRSGEAGKILVALVIGVGLMAAASGIYALVDAVRPLL